MNGRHALVVGASGLSGSHATAALAAAGWRVTGLSRSGRGPGAHRTIALDLGRPEAAEASRGEFEDVQDLVICTWSMQASEAENVRVNRAMLETLFVALEDAPLRHVSLVTGLKHYLGPFESYGSGRPYSPFLETQPRLPGDNFYYAQEDVVFAEAERRGIPWNVHRPHSMIGYALGNAMNVAVTLAVYASICKETGRPFVFPGSQAQYEAVADVTDARILARQIVWALQTPEAANLPLNVANGDVFRWYWLWARLAEYFDLEPAPYPGAPTPLQAQMADAEPIWEDIVARHGLQPTRLHEIASFWHSDADLGREIECITDMKNSRVRGFTAYQDTLSSFTDVFDRLRAERVIS
ncbi:hypothetical protein OG2516_16054 [Oceanicola granulosus HTCC2516]|uniref:PRISE-like Rossmann-fold domain-containing protein n=1 Tax=Oceanicola granulosus (strain ATCC BAA-861 / DSM 15982 / KCTC 12143 / HTCC2516) TaxID=314256 RepID=Q2CGV5_OCEGH|nr:SDR family oxidoreductase [Oceanicola granulosus]EAR51830.1 hypothetical protein OG2516_16054 [Oceanicola granulosus HTCC2516]